MCPFTLQASGGNGLHGTHPLLQTEVSVSAGWWTQAQEMSNLESFHREGSDDNNRYSGITQL